MCNHAYGLERVRCPECGAHIGSRCRSCGYEARYEEHAPGCRQAPQGGTREAAGPRSTTC